VFLGIGQYEGSVTLYILFYNNNDLIEASFVGRFPTHGSVSQIAISSIHFLIAAASDFRINLIDIGTRRILEPIIMDFRINCFSFDDHGALIIAGGYSVLSIWNISGRFLMKTNVDSSIQCIAIPNLNETVDNRFFITGHYNGSMKFWALDFSKLEIVLILSVHVSNCPIRIISINDTSTRIVVVTDNNVFCYDFYGSKIPNLKKDYALECSGCGKPIERHNSMTQKCKICSNCHRFFCTDCLPQERVIKISLPAQLQTNSKYLCPRCSSMENSMFY